MSEIRSNTNGGQIIDNLQIDNRQIDNRQIGNRQIDNRQIDNHNLQIDNLKLTFFAHFSDVKSIMADLQYRYCIQ